MLSVDINQVVTDGPELCYGDDHPVCPAHILPLCVNFTGQNETPILWLNTKFGQLGGNCLVSVNIKQPLYHHFIRTVSDIGLIAPLPQQ